MLSHADNAEARDLYEPLAANSYDVDVRYTANPSADQVREICLTNYDATFPLAI